MFIKELLTVSPNKRPTAAHIMNHTWIKKYVPAAYLALLDELNHEADPEFYKVKLDVPIEQRAPTLSRLRGKVPGTLQVEEQLAEPSEKVPLPNLLDNIAKRRFIKAVNAVKMVRVMSALSNKSVGTRSNTEDSLESKELSPTSTSASDLDAPGGVGAPSEEALKNSEQMSSVTAHDTETLEEKLAGITVAAGECQPELLVVIDTYTRPFLQTKTRKHRRAQCLN